MTTMGQRVRGWVQTIAGKPRSAEQAPPVARKEAGLPAATEPSIPGHSPIRVRIDPDTWRAIEPHVRKHDSGIHHPSAIGARSEIHSGKWEGPLGDLDPFGSEEGR